MRRIRQSAKAAGFKSGLEEDFSNQLKEMGIPVKYEEESVKYVIEHKYTPDFCVAPGIYVETKGRFTGKDITKHLTVKKQHPGIVVILVFQNPNIPITTNSKTNYGQWCTKNGIPWCKIGDKDAIKLMISVLK